MNEPGTVADAWSAVAQEYQRHIVPGFRPAARRLCEFTGIAPGMRVLDIACGPGTAAFEARRLGAVVTGVDASRGMIGLAREEAGNDAGASFVAGDALALPIADRSFDAAVSSFGLVFAPDAPLAVTELGRILRPGGLVGLLAWPRGGATGRYYAALERYIVPTPSAHDPNNWADPDHARAWLEPAFREVRFERIEVPYASASPAEAWRVMRTATGRVALAYRRLAAGARGRLDRDMEACFREFLAPDGTVLWNREATMIAAVRRQAAPASTSTRRTIG